MPHIKPKAESKKDYMYDDNCFMIFLCGIFVGLFICVIIISIFGIIKFVNASTLSASVPQNPCNQCLELCK